MARPTTTTTQLPMRNFWVCLLVAALQLSALVDASASSTPTASITQTSKNTFTIRGAQAELLKATIYNHQNKQQQYSQHTLHNPPIVLAQDIPIANQDHKWKSLNEDVEFIPAEGIDPQILRRFLEQNQDGASEYYEEAEESSRSQASDKMKSIYNVESFVYGGEEYDEYQQAWRLLGFIIDCHPMVDDDYYANEGGSGDHGTEDGCARYVLWAAVSVMEKDGMYSWFCYDRHLTFFLAVCRSGIPRWRYRRVSILGSIQWQMG
jgi:hypothetical protein